MRPLENQRKERSTWFLEDGKGSRAQEVGLALDRQEEAPFHVNTKTGGPSESKCKKSYRLGWREGERV